MKRLLKNTHTVSLVALVTVLIATPVMADDIEIYQAGHLGTAAVDPNILFILDTSGSMGTKLDVDEAYNASTDYSTKSGACFENDRMYPSTTTEISCTDTFKDTYFLLAQNQCRKATEAFAVTGAYNANFAQWDITKGTWAELKNNTDTGYFIDCSPDQGIHGKGGTETYINVSGAAPAYTSSSLKQELSWGSISSQALTMYSGNWMNYKIYSAGAAQVRLTRLQVMKNVISDLLYSMDDVNIGLMSYNFSEGGRIRYPVSPVSTGDNRLNMYTEVNNWDYEYYTPLSEALYEAYLYFTGGLVDYGDVHKYTGSVIPPTDADDLVDYNRSLLRVSVPESIISGTNPERYKSPVDKDFAGCQKQFIIYLSDGSATSDTSAENKIEALPGFKSTNNRSDCSGSGSGSCLDDLAGYMNRPQGIAVKLPDGTVLPAATSADDEPGVKVNTYTVGFGSDITSLSDAAREGGGKYYRANNANDLLEKLTSIISSIRGVHTTFSSPAVSVNAFNRTTHRSELYFTLFKPETAAHWDGNFKRFKLSFDTSGVPEIVDQNDRPAVSPVSGFFEDSALSYWTASADAPIGDGRDTSLGGAASKLFNGTPYTAGRKVYTSMTANALSDNSNRVWRAAAGVREAMGWDGSGATEAYYNKVVDWVRGIDVDDADADGSTTDARRVMGDPLHAQPALVQYGGTDTNPDITAYVATNDGLLHAISTATGVEQFAFLPPELLKDMPSLYAGGANKYYGLDGTVAPYIIDKNVNGIIEPGDGDKVYLYFGMRRGGSNVYALDVTNRDAPQLMWTIRGGVDGAGLAIDTSLGDYAHLGQTWSKPTVRKVRLNGADVPVLIFAAGYDDDQDNLSIRTVDDIGRGIYIVNALTGEPMWRMGPDGAADLTDGNMKYSIPSDVSAVDTDGDKYVDHIYVGDMGGQIWRVDINNKLGNTSTKLDQVTTGGRIADLADADIASNRRFFYPPSIAIGKDVNDVAYSALVLTSGNRSHPGDKDKVQDKIFMLRDTPVNGKPTTYKTVIVNNTKEDLYDATANLIGQGSDTVKATARTALNDAAGWFVDLSKSTGEKGLTKALIYGGEIFLTTYEPYVTGTTLADSCTPNEGTGYLYHIHLFDAQPVKNYDTIVSNDADALTREDRRVQLTRSGIPADPTVITTDEGSARCVGTECSKLEGDNLHKTIYWFEE